MTGNDSAEFTLSDPADVGESNGFRSQRQTEATSSHQIAHFFALANAVRAMAAAAIRVSTQSLLRIRSTCLQIVPGHALRITPISLDHVLLVGQREAAARITPGISAALELLDHVHP
jgi:hypothetical protein